MQMTLKEIRDAIVDMADMTNSEFITTANLNIWINLELSELHDLLVLSFQESILQKQSYTVTSSQENYRLPSDFYKCSKVYLVSNGSRVPMDRAALDSIDVSGGTVLDELITTGTCSSRYRILSDQLAINPPIDGTVELWYVPTFHKLESDSDRVDSRIPAGWEACVMAGVSARCMAKEESDPSFFLQQKQEARQRIKAARNMRDSGNRAIIDLSGRSL